MLAANPRPIGSSLWQCHTKPYSDTYRYSYTYNYANTDGDSYSHCNSNTNSYGKTYSYSEVYSHAERAPDSKAEALIPGVGETANRQQVGRASLRARCRRNRGGVQRTECPTSPFHLS